MTTFFNRLTEEQIKLLDWTELSRNDNPRAIELLESNLNKVDWDTLSANTAAIHLLEANLDKVNWAMLSANTAAIHLLEANLDKINWAAKVRFFSELSNLLASER